MRGCDPSRERERAVLDYNIVSGAGQALSPANG
jgi:hypothetical protein